MAWTHPIADDYRNVTTGQTAWTVTAGTVGDLRVIEFLTISASVNVSALSGGGVTTWTRAGSVNAVSSSSIGVAATAETWWGPVTSTGTALTITYAGTVGSTSCRAMRRDFRSNRVNPGQGRFSAVTQSFSQTNNITSTSPLTWSSITATRTGQLVVGVMGNNGGPTYTGITAGYTYSTDTDVNLHQYALSTAAGAAQAAQATFSGTDGWYVMQTIFDDGFAQPPMRPSLNVAMVRSGSY